MQMIYGDCKRAGLVRTGDIIEITDPVSNKPKIVTVVTSERITGINPKFPDSIHLQVDCNEVGRIAWGVSAVDYLQMVEEVRAVLPGFLQKKPQPLIEEPRKMKARFKPKERKGLRARIKR